VAFTAFELQIIKTKKFVLIKNSREKLHIKSVKTNVYNLLNKVMLIIFWKQ